MLLGIDLGTGSVKALLMDRDGQAIAIASSPYPVHAPHAGWAESDPADWWTAVAIAVRKVTADHIDAVQAIGLSGQMHGVVLTDREGLPLREAILWADTRSRDVLDRYYGLDIELQNRLANPIAAGMAGCSLLWLQMQEPEPYATARWALQPKDWLRLHLTGEVASDPSDASGTLLYDIAADDWAWEVLDALHLRADWLPGLRPSASIAGYLTERAATHLSLPTGLPIVTGAADTAAAALGSGLSTPGAMQLTIGSGAQIITLQAQPSPDAQRRTHLFRSALPQQWYRLAAIQNAGLVLEWVRELLGFTWAQVYAEAFAVPAGCEGVLFLPYLTGDRTPHLDPHARGAWVGLGLHHTRSHLMRAALEGVAFSLRQGLDTILAPMHPSVPPPTLRLAGGGTLEAPWKQLLADSLQVSLCSVAIAATSARGAALLAGLGIGIYADTDALPALKPLSSELTLPNPINPDLETARTQFNTLYPHLREWRTTAAQTPHP